MLVDALVRLVEHAQGVLAGIGRVVLQIVAGRVDARHFRNPVLGQQIVRIAVARRERAHLGMIEARHVSLLEQVHPLVRVAEAQPVRREVRMRMPAVIERHVVLLAEFAPHLRLGRRVRIVPEADAEAPVNHAAPHAIGARVAGLEQRNRMAERLRVRAERDLIQVPKARLIVIRIRQVVQLVPLDEFLQRFALRAAAFHVADESVRERDFPARKKSAVALRAGHRAVDARDRLALQIFLLERRIAHERVAEPAGRLVREHI